MKQLFLFIICFTLSGFVLSAQEKTKISVNKSNHNFGVVKEENGEVEHVFVIKNEGKSPLVIDRVTTSCGCTLPEWSKEPISPGNTKDIKVWYNPEGRPGKFYKTISIYSNADPRRFVMSIEGEVARKQPVVQSRNFPYSIGKLQMLSKTISFTAIRLNETLAEKIEVKNASEKDLTIRLENLPFFITAEARPVTLRPGEEGEIVFLLNAKGIGKKGRYHYSIPLKVLIEGGVPIKQNLSLVANIIDDFSKSSSFTKERAPSAQISSTVIDFGKVASKNSILGLGGKESMTFEIKNTGRMTLSVHSVTSDDDSLIEISGGKKEIKPNSSASYKVSIRPKDFKAKLESTITIVCNDPNGPIRLIKVTAEK